MIYGADEKLILVHHITLEETIINLCTPVTYNGHGIPKLSYKKENLIAILV